MQGLEGLLVVVKLKWGPARYNGWVGLARIGGGDIQNSHVAKPAIRWKGRRPLRCLMIFVLVAELLRFWGCFCPPP